ncbi:lipocalin family protein [Marinobacter sp. HL-58]|uniref:lipocalin family protein n=1 Tax=Marinobacter sp. HL-58 TaxID=1479237 RepID=UPI000487102A|nr:lipocalin family protein [Marinobacter sp. HL-58]KPQ01717.1 MAG: apolipoprotein D and lipocalin family protein [Marinobacter sp. HL-58]
MAIAKTLIISIVILMAGCTGVPEGIDPVSDLNAERYQGTWYEIARLDHSFEEGLSNVTAEYTVQDDGSIRVINRGYSEEDGQWEEAEGRAVFVNDEPEGHLKVSFFGPFYASYVVFELDEDYRYVYITGYDRDYLWFLSRSPTVDDDALAEFKELAEEKGFDLDELIVVDQSRNR